MDEPILILSGKSRASSAESIGHSMSRWDALSCDGSQSVRSWEPKNTTLGETSSCVGTTGIWDPRVKATLPSLVHWTLWGNWSSSAVPSVTENLCLPEWHLGQDIATHHLFYSSLAVGQGNGELLHNEKTTVFTHSFRVSWMHFQFQEPAIPWPCQEKKKNLLMTNSEIWYK